MLSVVKAQFYQMKKDIILPLIFFAVMILEAAICIVYSVDMITAHNLNPNAPYPSADDIITALLPTASMFGSVFVISAAAAFCCSDFSDKTINYEIMTGHTRADSFFGRAIPAVAFGVVGFMALLLIPAAVLIAVFGWAEYISLGDLLLRMLLLGVIEGRLACEFVFISFIVKHRFAVMAGGYVLTMAAFSMPFLSESTSQLLALTNMNLISRIDSWASFGLQGSINFVYEAAIDPQTALSTLLYSAVFAGAFLLLGYSYFKRDDIN
ncbi:MAG: hypothetical protein ACI4Q4_05625 [Oscillospiraceae bacterium]